MQWNWSLPAATAYLMAPSSRTPNEKQSHKVQNANCTCQTVLGTSWIQRQRRRQNRKKKMRNKINKSRLRTTISHLNAFSVSVFPFDTFTILQYLPRRVASYCFSFAIGSCKIPGYNNTRNTMNRTHCWVDSWIWFHFFLLFIFALFFRARPYCVALP